MSALRIEDYGIVGNLESAAVVGRDGSIDWLCLPRFDSGAFFAALLGDEKNGCWRLCPSGEGWKSSQAYRGETLVLETTFTLDGAKARVIDFMPPRHDPPTLIRIVEGIEGTVEFCTELIMRFDYGRIRPWARRKSDGLLAVAGADALQVYSDALLHGKDFTTVADFRVESGQRVAFSMAWHRSCEAPPPRADEAALLAATEAYWKDWCSHCNYQGEWRSLVMRSLITLKALTYESAGGVLAAATTSLPEQIGGYRNWDYRYCWLRDSTFTLMALMSAGYTEEAGAWRDWLLRAVAGDPSELQIMYGPEGERRLDEYEIGWLAGYERSQPVRVGNAAAGQLQLDVYGELLDSIHQATCAGLPPEPYAWKVQRALIGYLEKNWRQPDRGIWEVRGPQRHFVHSKVMAWVAFDRAIKSVEKFGVEGSPDRWAAIRQEIHDQVCREGFHPGRKAFTQSYGSEKLDASVLLIPLVGFLPPEDPRVRSTVEAIEHDLVVDGFVIRYHRDPSEHVGELAAGEGSFLACSFWLADNYVLLGRMDDARALFQRLLSVCNPLGLLAEQYDPKAGRQLGNFPQAFSHVGLINTAHNISAYKSPARDRKNT
ncbi:MAG TPA: glycoside hydrolase family 15 protein [Chthoniobacterales bacterium]